MPGPAAEAALASLAAVAPAELSRVARLREIHATCAAAGIVPPASVGSSARSSHAGAIAPDPGLAGGGSDGAEDVERLHALFDAAVEHGMPQLVCHYVDEVCGHDDFTSPDGVQVSVASPACAARGRLGRRSTSGRPFRRKGAAIGARLGGKIDESDAAAAAAAAAARH